jgi:hypothetical protein
MDPRQLFADVRHGAFCVFCGDAPTTREHAASRVLLDDPLPDDLPMIGSCRRCNNGFSQDEEYVACLIDCILSGSTDPVAVRRPKVRAALLNSPALAARIEAGRSNDASGNTVWVPEEKRILKVIVKLARGHVAHQYSEPRLEDPSHAAAVPLAIMDDNRREAFETVPENQLWPEIGSRAFVTVLVGGDRTYDLENGWSVLQAARYRCLVAQATQTLVRIVLSEYLAAEVLW